MLVVSVRDFSSAIGCKQFDDFSGDAAGIYGGRLQLHVARFNPRKIQKIIDHAGESFDVVFDPT